MKFKKLNMNVGTESLWCSMAYSAFSKPRVCKQGKEMYYDLNSIWRLLKDSAQWSWMVRIQGVSRL